MEIKEKANNKCTWCNCVYEFVKEDIIIGEKEAYVECPVCGMRHSIYSITKTTSYTLH